MHVPYFTKGYLSYPGIGYITGSLDKRTLLSLLMFHGKRLVYCESVVNIKAKKSMNP